jgi:hypothetical protein
MDRPEGKRLSFFKSRISAINKIQTSVVTGTQEWFVFPELQGVEGASILPKRDPHHYPMPVCFLADGNNFCWDKCHCDAFNSDFSEVR